MYFVKRKMQKTFFLGGGIMEEKKLSIEEIAKACGKSVRTVYRRARELGRLPTLEEMKEPRPKTGRPRKYF